MSGLHLDRFSVFRLGSPGSFFDLFSNPVIEHTGETR